MSTAAEEVEAEIRRVFPAHRPDDIGRLSNGYLDENIRIMADLAVLTDWTTTEPKLMAEIDRNSGFGFLTQKAALFYLPALLIADLEGAELNSDPTFYLCTSYPSTTTDEIIAWQLTLLGSRWDALNSAQAAAVCRYLEWYVAVQSRGGERAAAFSLSAYWYQRT